MRALTVSPGVPNSMRLEEVPEPAESDGDVLVETLAIGICGTDREIASGAYGSAPEGSDRLIIGHESLGRVKDAPRGSGLQAGDLIVGIVRRPDPVPCPACAHGEWDMCRNGQYTERGIKDRNGYASERFRVEAGFAIKVDPQLGECAVLLEPTSVVAKAWDQIERIGARTSAWRPQTVLVTGAGPIGLLAAMLAKQRGCELHVLDHAGSGPKPELVRALGATYHNGALDGLEPDLVIECTGVTSVILDAVARVHERPLDLTRPLWECYVVSGLADGGVAVALVGASEAGVELGGRAVGRVRDGAGEAQAAHGADGVGVVVAVEEVGVRDDGELLEVAPGELVRRRRGARGEDGEVAHPLGPGDRPLEGTVASQGRPEDEVEGRRLVAPVEMHEAHVGIGCHDVAHLGGDLVAGGEPGEPRAPGAPVGGGGGRAGGALAAAEQVGGDDEIAIRVDRAAGSDEVAPPAGGGVAGTGVAGDVRVAGEGVEDEDGVVAGG